MALMKIATGWRRVVSALTFGALLAFGCSVMWLPFFDPRLTVGALALGVVVGAIVTPVTSR